MKKWFVTFDDESTVETLEAMGILHYKPLFYQKVKVVIIETEMTTEEILAIEGVVACREERIGTIFV